MDRSKHQPGKLRRIVDSILRRFGLKSNPPSDPYAYVGAIRKRPPNKNSGAVALEEP